jgi:hypothetical protein
MSSELSPNPVPMLHWYDEDETLVYAGKIADQLIGAVDTGGFTDDEVDAMRNAAAEACEKIMWNWKTEPENEDMLPLELVLAMERAGSLAIIQVLNKVLARKTQQNGDLTKLYSLV